MTVATTSRKVQYDCDGSTYEFDFSFPVQEEEDIAVIVTDSDGNETALSLTSDFEVSSASGTYESGGTVTTVTYASGSRATKSWADGYTITIYRDTALLQEVEFRNNRQFRQSNFETALDRIVMMIQDLDERIDRIVTVPITDTGDSLELPAAASRANKYLAFDGDGDPIASAAAISTVAVSALWQSILDDEDLSAIHSTMDLSHEIDVLYEYGDGTNYTLAAINDALTAIGSDPATILLRPGSWGISDDLTIPANVTLKPAHGALMVVGTGKVLTINGPFEAGLRTVFTNLTAGSVVFGSGSVEKAYPQWWGGAPDNSTDNTNAIAAALRAHHHVHLVAGIWKITDEILMISGIQGTGAYWGYKTLSGDGLRTIIRQVTATKNVLSLKYFYHTDGQDFWLEGMTVRDMSLIGEASTYDALYLEGVHRCHFENLNCLAGRYGIYIKGALENSFADVRSSKSLWDENPVSGVTPATPSNGLRTVKLEAFSGDMSVNVNDFRNIFCEKASSDGMNLSDFHGNRMFATVESNGGTGIYMVTGCIQNEIKVWSEGHDTDDLYIDGDYQSRISIICADDKAVTLLNCVGTRLVDSHIGTLDVQATSTGVALDNVTYTTSLTDNGVQTSVHQLRTGALWAAGTLVKMREYRTGTASPISAITPAYVGQLFFDTVAKHWYQATGTAANTDWVQLG